MLDTLTPPEKTVDMKARQAPLRERYQATPQAAFISDHATTRCDRIETGDPLYAEVEFGDPQSTRLPLSLHKGVGGQSDLPVPGELLSAAIAGCLDSTIRVIANMFGLQLELLEVHVEAKADLRGTLRMDASVPTAFQEIDIAVNIVPKTETPQEHLDAIVAAAEQSCVVLQTLRQPPRFTLHRT